ncbi:MAG: class I SAM-dependent methyltransferase [Polyangiaceae bacterium]
MDDNKIIIEAWNTVLFEKFCRFQHLLVDSLSRHSDEALSRMSFGETARVLDIGCGFGDSTQLIAKKIGARGVARGVDCASENFVAQPPSRRERPASRTPSSSSATCRPTISAGLTIRVFARFGTMFFNFNLPGAAMRNVRKALVPGGTFTQIVWRKREDNPWLHEAELRVKAIVPIVSRGRPIGVHCGPGPFSMSGFGCR